MFENNERIGWYEAMAEEAQIFVVGGIGFQDMESAKMAQNELKRIEVLDEKMDYSNTEGMAAVYEKARQNHVFRTPIGISYMMRIQNYLVQKQYPGISDMPILVDTKYGKPGTDKVSQEGSEIWRARLDSARDTARNIRRKLRVSLIINFVLVLLVVALFVISQTGNNPTILNYRTKIINEYSQWQQQLEEREAAISEKEANLGMTDTSQVNEE